MIATSSQHRATQVLNNLGVILHQTDTVIGLASLPEEALLQRLSRIKLRKMQKGFILLASSIEHVNRFIHVNSESLKLISAPNPNPTTWLVNASDKTPPSLLGRSGKVAIRITHHQNIKSICANVGAIASTSANLSEQAVCTDLVSARKIFGPCVDYIEQDPMPGTGKASSIIDLVTGEILRN